MIIQTFLKRCDALAARRGITRARLSTLLFNDGKRLQAIEDGLNIGVLTLQRAEAVMEELESSAPEPAK